MKVGIVFWHRRGSPIEEEFSTLLNFGFEGVEVTISEATEACKAFSARGYLNIERLTKDVSELRRASRNSGLEIHSVRSGLLWKYPLTSPNPETRKKAEKIVQLGIKVASKLEASTLLVVPGVVTEDIAYDDAYTVALNTLKKVSKIAEKNAVYIGVENVKNNFLLSPLEMRRFLDEVGSEYVKAYLDIGNVLALGQGYPQHWIKILSSRIVKVHLKDFDIKRGVITYLFHGDVNWTQVMSWLKKVGYNDYLTAELEPYKLNPEKFYNETASAIRTMIRNLS